MFTRLMPLLGLAFIVVFCLMGRSWLQYLRYGQFGIVLFQSSDRRKQVRDTFFALLFVALLAQAIVFAWSPESLTASTLWLLPLGSAWIGLITMLLGSTLILAAQLRMGSSWRVGIDETAAPGLVTSGLYQFCRNPIYLGLFLCMAGLTLLLPTWISLVLNLGVFWCIRTQTLEEEAYLERTYGGSFRDYASRVGRFWPGLGKLSQAV